MRIVFLSRIPFRISHVDYVEITCENYPSRSYYFAWNLATFESIEF